VPFASAYYKDGIHALKAWGYGLESADIALSAAEPYADVIGFSNGEGLEADSAAETTEQRINFVVKTIPEILPKADLLVAKTELIKTEIDQINPDRYPEEVKGIKLRSTVEDLINTVDVTATLLKNGRPFLEVLPAIIGSEGDRKYMVLFQNDKELRPTGGFITAYSMAKVYDGHFEPILSSDIYDLDNLYKPAVPAPDVFPKYLKGIYQTNNRFRLRDMNWNPDYEASMKTFIGEVEKNNLISDIDGIIAVDTQLLVYLLDVIGPIGVPGFGNFSTEIVPECKCPQVIYELELFADTEGAIVWSENEPGKIVYAPPNYDDRKKIIGPLMNSILANTMGQPKEKLPDLFEAAINGLLEKHVLFYMVDEKEQSAVKSFGIGGTIAEYDGDYMYVNNANLGGRKSNLYVTYEVQTDYEIKSSGNIIKTLTLTYKNPEKQDGWLNSVLPNWLRVYVPKGSKLISADGLEDKKDAYEESGKTVFSGGFNLRPQGVVKVVLKYEIPITKSKNLKVYIQKQPGTNEVRHIISVNGKSKTYMVKTDKEIDLAQ
jgi:hypothetical protein